MCVSQAFTFQTFTLDEAAQLLSTFSVSDNMTIIFTMSILVACNVLCIFWLGYFRGHRKKLKRLRNNNLSEDEAFAQQLRKSYKFEHKIIKTCVRQEAKSTAKQPVTPTGRSIPTELRASQKIKDVEGEVSEIEMPMVKTNCRRKMNGSDVSPVAWAENKTATSIESLHAGASVIARLQVRRRTAGPYSTAEATKAPRAIWGALAASAPPRVSPSSRSVPPPPDPRMSPPTSPPADDDAESDDEAAVHKTAHAKRLHRHSLEKREQLAELKRIRSVLSTTPAEEHKPPGLIARGLKAVGIFCYRLYETSRSEHTLVAFLAPLEGEESLTHEQLVQLFFSTLYWELALLCLLHTPMVAAGGSGGRRQRGGSGSAVTTTSTTLALNANFFGVSLVTALTQGILVAVLTMALLSVFAYAFKLSNSRRRPPEPAWVTYKRIAQQLMDGITTAVIGGASKPRLWWERTTTRRAQKRAHERAEDDAREAMRLQFVQQMRIEDTSAQSENFIRRGIEPPPPSPRVLERSETTLQHNEFLAWATPITSNASWNRSRPQRTPQGRLGAGWQEEPKAATPLESTSTSLISRGTPSPPPSPPADETSLATVEHPKKVRFTSVESHGSTEATWITPVLPLDVVRPARQAKGKLTLKRAATVSCACSPLRRSHTSSSACMRPTSYALAEVQQATNSKTTSPPDGSSAASQGTASDTVGPRPNRALRRANTMFPTCSSSAKALIDGISYARPRLTKRALTKRSLTQRIARTDGSKLAVVALMAQRKKKKKDMLWRSDSEVRSRRVMAWGFLISCDAFFLFYALIVSIRFGEEEAAILFASWGAAYLYAAVLLEPTVICILAAFPFVANENTRLGRCCLRIKWVWDELLSP